MYAFLKKNILLLYLIYTDKYTHKYTHTHTYIYIYIYYDIKQQQQQHEYRRSKSDPNPKNKIYEDSSEGSNEDYEHVYGPHVGAKMTRYVCMYVCTIGAMRFSHFVMIRL